jgi:hypothetical protein
VCLFVAVETSLATLYAAKDVCLLLKAQLRKCVYLAVAYQWSHASLYFENEYKCVVVISNEYFWIHFHFINCNSVFYFMKICDLNLHRPLQHFLSALIVNKLAALCPEQCEWIVWCIPPLCQYLCVATLPEVIFRHFRLVHGALSCYKSMIATSRAPVSH